MNTAERKAAQDAIYLNELERLMPLAVERMNCFYDDKVKLDILLNYEGRNIGEKWSHFEWITHVNSQLLNDWLYYAMEIGADATYDLMNGNDGGTAATNPELALEEAYLGY